MKPVPDRLSFPGRLTLRRMVWLARGLARRMSVVGPTETPVLVIHHQLADRMSAVGLPRHFEGCRIVIHPNTTGIGIPVRSLFHFWEYTADRLSDYEYFCQTVDAHNFVRRPAASMNRKYDP